MGDAESDARGVRWDGVSRLERRGSVADVDIVDDARISG